MSRNEYQRQLEQLRTDVRSMSDLVCDRLEAALTALEDTDETLADRVIEGDHEINELYLDIEGDCIELLALQQPVAGDLRFIAASFKIITDLERIADLAVNLAEYAKQAARDRYPHIDITAIGERTLEMVSVAMDAYAADDASTTREIAAMDDEIDDRCEHASEIVVQDLLETEIADDALFDDVSRMLLTIRDLERIGDHAVNIAARVLHMVDNDAELIY
ncbi:phosphate signaling complex protein PhoU [Halopiger aswanensis]|uniref:Phosphate-specific transport system accessory protein PhoU n=1 Tax=Halopiger aswanensis TaxID=148449 RepID=A0A3R7EH67_9EURY|nr:phosphate signaling complex protein PhoU [Halopiger aswanensis]RKD97584.1 phosphate transport system protein [Halopiger aswanensis]